MKSALDIAREREEFEKWASDPIRAEKLPLDRWPTNDGYKDTRTYIAFYAWKAGRASLPPQAVEPVAITTPAMLDCIKKGFPATMWPLAQRTEYASIEVFTAPPSPQTERDAEWNAAIDESIGKLRKLKDESRKIG